MKRSIFRLPTACSTLIAGLLVGGCATSTTDTSRETDPASEIAADLPGAPSATAYATFDEVWSTVDTMHFDPDHNGVDWEAMRLEYRPRIEDTRSDKDVRKVLRAMLAELGQTHFVIMPSENAATSSDDESSETSDESPSSDPGTAGLRFGWLGEEAIVIAVSPDSPAAEAGVRPGWIVERVDGELIGEGLSRLRRFSIESKSPMAEYEALARLNANLSTSIGEEVEFDFRDGNDAVVCKQLTFVKPKGVPVRFGLLPEVNTLTESRILSPAELETWGVEEGPNGWPEIVHLSFNVWMFPILVPIAETVDAHRDADGFVIDLRGNPGGLGGLAMGVAGHFLAEPESLGSLEQRDASMEFTVNPQRATPDGRLVDPFAGPVMILTDRMSASTSEVFAAGLQQLDRATVVGRPSAGAALPAHLTILSNGDTFMFAVADFIGPAGHSIEGTGVQPDRLVKIERARLLAEGDPDLAEAVRSILDSSP
jgi:carboxyl-terminal processing protease